MTAALVALAVMVLVVRLWRVLFQR